MKNKLISIVLAALAILPARSLAQADTRANQKAYIDANVVPGNQLTALVLRSVLKKLVDSARSDLDDGIPVTTYTSSGAPSNGTGRNGDVCLADTGVIYVKASNAWAPAFTLALGTHTHTASQISDSTTVGRNLMTLANPGAVRFARIDANNGVTLLDAQGMINAILGSVATGKILKFDGTNWGPADDLTGGGGYVPPTGTGFVHITSNSQDASAALVQTADISNNQVTNGKAAQMPAHTYKGNNTGSTANAADLTISQVKTDLAIDNVNNTSDAGKPVSTAQQTALDLKADAATGTSAQTNDYTLALTDAQKVVTLNNAAAKTITVPLNSSVAFPIGTRIWPRQLGAGAVSIAAAGGVTITQRNGTNVIGLAGHYATLFKTGTDTWDLSVEILDQSTTTSPAGTDDASKGYQVGSSWRNTTSGVLFQCVDNTTSSAVWVAISPDATAFASSWSGRAASATGNAIYNWGHTFDTDDDGKVNLLDNVSVAGTPYVNSSGLVQGTRVLAEASGASTYLVITNADGSTGNPTVGASNRVKNAVDNIVIPLTIDALANSMNYGLTYLPQNFTVTDIWVVHVQNGTALSTPSISLTLKFGTNRTSGTAVVSGGSTITSSTTGDHITSFTNATLSGFLWAETASKSGTTGNLEIYLIGHY